MLLWLECLKSTKYDKIRQIIILLKRKMNTKKVFNLWLNRDSTTFNTFEHFFSSSNTIKFSLFFFLLFFSEHVDTEEAKNLFEANYSHVYYILYDTFVQAETNLRQRGKILPFFKLNKKLQNSHPATLRFQCQVQISSVVMLTVWCFHNALLLKLSVS